MDKAKQQWFADTMRGHLIEMRANAATLHLCLSVIDLTGESPTHNKQVPAELAAKTGNLEKSLRLRQFITKALAIERAESPDLFARDGDGKVSACLPSLLPESAQRITFHDVVQLARQQALAQKTRNANQDLIDLSDSTGPLMNSVASPTIQDDLLLLDFDNPTFFATTLPRSPIIVELEAGPYPNEDTAKVDPIELEPSCLKGFPQAKPTDSIALLGTAHPNVQFDQPSEAPKAEEVGQPGLEAVDAKSPSARDSHIDGAIQLNAPLATNEAPAMPQASNIVLIDRDQSFNGVADQESLASSTATSIFSHSSHSTALTGASLRGNSEEDIQSRHSMSQLTSKTLSLNMKGSSSLLNAQAPILESSSQASVCSPPSLPELPKINEPDEQGFPWIVQAARDGHEEIIRKLLISGADIQVTHTKTRRNALAEASLHSHHSSIAKSLIGHGASINAPGPDGRSALHLAIAAPYQNLAMLLIQHKANVNARDKRSRTPLHIAASQGNIGYLVGEGAQIDSREAQSRTPLQFACEAGNYGLVQMMMDKSSLSASNMTFLTAFFTAVEHGHVQIAESFFSKGLKLQELKRDRNKLLTLAATSGCLAMIELMIHEDCETTQQDDDGWNALHFASHHGHYQVIEQLLSTGVPATVKTSRKETPLLLAVKNGHFPVVERLLRSDKGSVLTSVEDERNQLPVHHAVRNGSLEIFELLMSNGGKINVENSFGWLPLHIATAYGHLQLAERILKQGANIEEKLGSTSVKKDHTHKIVEEGYWAEARWPYPGSRALHLACEYSHDRSHTFSLARATYFGSSDLVETLLQGGANPHAPTNEGKPVSTLGFCTVGSSVGAFQQERIHRLLEEAMNRVEKQKKFKVALKKASTVQDKHNFLQAATFSMNVTSRPQLHKAKTTVQVPRSDATRSGSVSSSFRPQPPLHAHSTPLPSTEFSANATTGIPSPSGLPAIQLEEEPASSLRRTDGIAESTKTVMSSDSQTAHNATHTQTLPAPSPETTLATQINPKLQRRTTFGLAKVKPGLDISKLSLAGMSKPTFDIGKQTLELGNKTLGLGKQGFELSMQGLEKGNKQGLDMGKKGMEKSRESYNKAIKFATKKGKGGKEVKKKGSGKGDCKVVVAGGTGEADGMTADKMGEDDVADDGPELDDGDDAR
ncbi:MAG: hypothetical protein Q9169_008204, partial [Polycauliona sp. 2 TL-2023]